MKAGMLDMALFIEWLKENTALAESTLTLYKEIVSNFLSTNPDIDDINAYNDYLIAKTIKKRNYMHFYAIREWIKYKISDTKLRNDLITQMIRPKMNKDLVVLRRHLSDDEIMEVINNLQSNKHRVIALLQSLTGARAGDIFRIKRDDVQVEEYKGEVVMKLNIRGKGNKRSIKSVFDPIGQKVLLEYIGSASNMYQDYCFLEKNNLVGKWKKVTTEFRLIKTNYLWYWMDLKAALEMSGINQKDFATHDFRRCFARKVWDKYKDMVLLQSVLDHERPETTIRYLKQSGLQNQDVYKEIQS